MGTMKDLRRTDLRTGVLENPYWITSANLPGTVAGACEDQAAVFFAFPITGGDLSPGYGNSAIIVHDVLFEVVTAYTGGTPLIDIGTTDIPLETTTTGGTTGAGAYDVDDYIASGDITVATPALYGPTAQDWLGMAAANTYSGRPRVLVAIDAAVPCIAAYLTNTGTTVAGAGVLHALISVIPVVR